jgi:glycosyltransferase involved in cell wall biosynthesis
MEALARALLKTGEAELLVVTFVAAEKDVQIVAEEIRHYHVGIPPKQFNQEFSFSPSATTRAKTRRILADFRPDVVHIHGTEFTYGLMYAEGDIQFPTVISLQGLLGAYSRPMADGLFCSEFLRSHTLKELLRNSGLYHMRRNMAIRGEQVERRIFSSSAWFVGRTRYDRACLRSVNPKANYSYGDEVMHPSFYSAKRDPQNVIPHRIFSPTGLHPRKGLHCLLKAVSLLKEEYPDILLRMPARRTNNSWRASGYGKYINRMIRTLDLEKNVAFLGPLASEEMAKELAAAEVFALASYEDNSPSSLTEAMLVGTPAIVSLAGGIPCRVRDGETALCFPAGDEIVLAECLRMIFEDPALAKRLATQAQIVARERNDPEKVAQTMLEIYRQAIETASREVKAGTGV